MRTLFLSGCAAVIFLAACQQPTSEAKPDDYTAKGAITLSIPEMKTKMEDGNLTAEKLVSDYIDRIKTVDWAGPQIQSVLTLNPNAISEARRLDQMRADGNILGPLHGVPILLKDNIETTDNMPTTAGAYALKDNLTKRDSPLAAGLRSQGAIILGKTNLSQWANFRSNDSMSGWSALGGQTKNPHYLDRNPCGSSSGSGAGIAAFMGAGAVGTETNGSIICPSNANGIVGFKPTVGLVSQQYIVPISSSQDTAGPMTRSVMGAALMLDAMDNQTTDYAAQLDEAFIAGKRIGVMRFAQGSNGDIQARFKAATEKLEEMGAVLVEIETFEPDTENFWGKSFDVLKYEFKATLNDYLADTPETVTARSLSAVISFNQDVADKELSLFGQDILETSDEMGPLTDQDYITKRGDIQRASGPLGIDKLMAENNVDVLISPSGPVAGRVDPINGDVWPSWAGAGYLAAVAGYPHITVPMGQIDGMPIGLSFMAGKGEDAKVLSYGYAYEQATNHIKAPEYFPSAESNDGIARAMARKKD